MLVDIGDRQSGRKLRASITITMGLLAGASQMRRSVVKQIVWCSAVSVEMSE